MKTRKSFSLMDKMVILNEVEVKKKSRAEITREFNVSRTTLSNILKNADQIKKSAETGSLQRRRMRKGMHEELEEQLFKFFEDSKKNNHSTATPLLKRKAASLAALLNIPNFKCSSGWFENWKKRFGLTSQKVCGESENVDLKEIEKWHIQNDELLYSYLPEDRYVFSEFGLFYRALPDNALALKGIKCDSGKLCKIRMTVGLCVNQTGTDKLRPLVIGRYSKPRCFKSIKLQQLPIHYASNKRAWMTDAIFQQFLAELNDHIACQERKILLLLENVPGRTFVGMSHVAVIPLPTASRKMNPMNNGVVLNVKIKYRRKLLQYYQECIEMGVKKFPKWDVVRAGLVLEESWREIPSHIISSSWGMADVRDSKITSGIEITKETHELSQCCKLYFRQMNIAEPHFTVDDYIRVDDDLIISDVKFEEPLSKEIADGNPNEDEESYTGEDSAPEFMPPSREAVLDALHTLRQIKYTRLDVPKEFLDSFNVIEKTAHAIYGVGIGSL